MNKLLLIASFIFVLFCAEKGFACTCMDIDPNKNIENKVERAFQNSDAVFYGKVLRIEKSADLRKSTKVTLRLIKSWKGNLGKSVLVTTASSSGMCGLTFRMGKTYLIYADRYKREPLSTNICGRSGEVSSPPKDFEILDGLKNKS